MKDFIDRVPTYKGRKTITYEDGTQEIVTIENADEPTVDGTFINRENLMAMQGFIKNDTIFEDGKIIETNGKGETLTTTFDVDSDGNDIIIENFVGKETITKTTTFYKNGNISEVIS